MRSVRRKSLRTPQSCVPRYECKYLVDEAMAERVRAAIAPFVHADPHARGHSTPAYDVHSLYLDAPDLRLFWESEEGQCRRLKLRVRHYANGSDNGPVFLEIKRRVDRCIRKSRAALDRRDAAALLAGQPINAGYLSDLEKECLVEFESWVARWRAHPIVWIQYRREAYEGRYHPGVRVTFDRRLRCAPVGPEFTPDTAVGRELESRAVILELKFNKAFPDWIKRLVQRYELRRISYSKYGHAVRRGLGPHHLPPGCAWAVPNG